MSLKRCVRCGRFVILGRKVKMTLPSGQKIRRDDYRWYCTNPDCGGELERVPCKFCGSIRHVSLRLIGGTYEPCCQVCFSNREEA